MPTGEPGAGSAKAVLPTAHESDKPLIEKASRRLVSVARVVGRTGDRGVRGRELPLQTLKIADNDFQHEVVRQTPGQLAYCFQFW